MTVPAVHPWPTNAHLIEDVAKLGYLDGVVLDATYGRGRFWTRWAPRHLIRHDLHHLDGVDFRDLPEVAGSLDAVVLDPPYRLNGTPDQGDFDDAYGIDKAMTWQEKHAMIRGGITEAARVLRRGGFLLLKCQDQVCSGAVRWQTDEFAAHAATVKLRKVDRFDMTGHVRKQPTGRRQKHAHGRPSTLLVFEKTR